MRRAQENSAVLGSVGGENQILWKEIMDRIFRTHISLQSAPNS